MVSPRATRRATSARSFLVHLLGSSFTVKAALWAAVPFSAGRAPLARMPATTCFSVALAVIWATPALIWAMWITS